MNRRTQLLGIVGAVSVLLGLTSSVFVGPDHIYAIVHWIAGGLFLVGFLALNAAGLRTMFAGRATRQLTYTLVFGSTLLIAIVAANIIAVNFPKSFDWTQDQLFTLSEQSENVLETLSVDTKAYLFVPGGEGGPWRDLLNQYAYRNKYFTYEIVDPEVELETVQKFNITADKPVLVLEAGLRSQVVQEISENSITNALVQLEGGRQYTAYVITEHGELDINDNETSEGVRLLVDQLRIENFDVKELNLLRMVQVPDKADVVLVLAPQRSFIEEEIRQLQRYLKFGGRMLIATDPGIQDHVQPLLAPLGVVARDSVIVDQQVRMFAGPTMGVQPLVSDYAEGPVGDKMRGLRTTYQTACALQHESRLGVEITELARTSSTSWGETNITLIKEGKVGRDDADIPGPVNVALLIDGYTTPATNEPPLIGHAKIAVFCDTDFLTNKWIQQLANMDIIVNTVNWLAGKESDIVLRPKPKTASNLFLTEDEMINIFFLTVLIFPELLLLAGLVIWWRRRS